MGYSDKDIIILSVCLFTLTVAIVMYFALCMNHVYRRRCKLRDQANADQVKLNSMKEILDAEHAYPQNIPIFYPDETRRNSVKELRSRPENVLQSRPERKNEEADNEKSHECVSLSSSLGDEKIHVLFESIDILGGDSRYDKGMKKSLAKLIIAANDKPVVWAPPPPPPPPDPPNPNS